MSRTRLLLADDHVATLQRWRELIEPEFEVVGTVTGGGALVDAYELLQPDVVVCDIVMHGIHGLAAAEMILRHNPGARFVFATIHADRAMLRKSIAVGAFGYVLKVRVAEDLVPAIRAALRGELHISPFPVLEQKSGAK